MENFIYREDYSKYHKEKIPNVEKTYKSYLNDLEILRDLRANEQPKSWINKQMIYLYRHFALIAGYDCKTALKMTKAYNKKLNKPLTIRKLELYTKHAETSFLSNTVYYYTGKTLIFYLSITNEELKHLNLSNDENFYRLGDYYYQAITDISYDEVINGFHKRMMDYLSTLPLSQEQYAEAYNRSVDILDITKMYAFEKGNEIGFITGYNKSIEDQEKNE